MLHSVKNINVVVIGGIHHNTLGVIRSLGEGGIPSSNIHVLLISPDKDKTNIISKSIYVTQANVDYLDDLNKIVEWLSELAKDKVKRVVICCADGPAEIVIKNSKYLSPFYMTPTTLEDISELMEKDVQGRIALECGLRIPKSTVFKKGCELNWDCFPCITKPLKSILGAGKKDIIVIESEDELYRSLSELKANSIEIQEYIIKQMEFQLIGCSLDAGNRVIIPGFTNIIRQPKNTNTGYLKYSDIKDLEFCLNPVYKFLQKIGYNGLFSMEFLRGKDGKDYYLEINLRNDGNAYCVQTAGINLPLIWAYYQTYNEMPATNLFVKKPIYFIPDFNDLKVAYKIIGISGWIRDFLKADSHSIFNKKDMAPFFCEILRLCKKSLHI